MGRREVVYIISRKTSRELRESLAESASKSEHRDRGVAGVVRHTEEAAEVSDRIRREDGSERVYVVDANAPESKQARIEIAQRLGSKDPEGMERFV